MPSIEKLSWKTTEHGRGDIDSSVPLVPSVTLPSSMVLWKKARTWMFVGVAFLAFTFFLYEPYLKRFNNNEKHQRYLEFSGDCDNFLPDLLRRHNYPDHANTRSKMYSKLVLYEGIETSCDVARSHVNTWVIIGALSDCWYNSNFYALWSAESVWLKLLYSCVFFACAITFVYVYFRGERDITWAETLSKLFSNNASTTTAPDGRRVVIAPKRPSVSKKYQ